MSYVAEEIASQPEVWSRVLADADDLTTHLPSAGERVAVVGCGTSWHIALAYARRRESSGLGETDAFAASEAPLDRRYDRVVGISRSGTTTEVLDLLERLRGHVPTVAVTAVDGAPIAEVADDTVILGFADERSVVQTRFATTVLVLLRASLGEELAGVVTDARTALDDELPAEAVEAEQLTFLGRGWTVGLAEEAALKLRETSRAWAEAYPAMEYRHGPISIATSGRCVWMLGPSPDGLEDDVRRTGADLLVSSIDPLAEVVRAQRVAVARAERLGLDPDQPRHLTRSVILPSVG